ncbi:hypothetical protein IKW75_02345 [Candidatus Saccharibacteria bacterium]|nr:hypothetical protein [Candidatus Saccharibacteria bacterium]
MYIIPQNMQKRGKNHDFAGKNVEKITILQEKRKSTPWYNGSRQRSVKNQMIALSSFFAHYALGARECTLTSKRVLVICIAVLHFFASRGKKQQATPNTPCLVDAGYSPSWFGL